MSNHISGMSVAAARERADLNDPVKGRSAV